MRAKFLETDDRELVVKFAGSAEKKTLQSYKDDGISQKVTVSSGIASREEALVPTIVSLMPYSTFTEVSQMRFDWRKGYFVMGKIMNNNYVCIQSWMVTELGLKGNELLVYAIIYGFCQDGAHHFKGSRSYLAEWTNSTVRNVQTMLNKLVEKGLLAKEEKLTENNVRQCEYFPVNLPWEKSEVEDEVPETEVVSGDASSDIDGENTSPVVKNFHGGSEKISPEVVKKFHRGGEKISPNNIDNNIRDNIKDTSSSSEPPQKSDGRKDREVEQVVASWNSLSEFGIKSIS